MLVLRVAPVAVSLPAVSLRALLARHEPGGHRTERGPARPGKEGLLVATGIVKWFNADKGYGFITQAGGSAEVLILSVDRRYRSPIPAGVGDRPTHSRAPVTSW